MNESSFIRSVHRKLDSAVDWWKINDRFENGAPDAWYCGDRGRHLFIEYKFEMLPARGTTAVKANLSLMQLEWLKEKQRRGIPCAVVLGTEQGGVWFDDFELARRGLPKNEIMGRLLSTEQIAGLISRICAGESNESNDHSEGSKKRGAVAENLATEEAGA